MNNLHVKRFNKLINYIEQQTDVNIELRRKDIANIVGVSEGDSLKQIFKILNNQPEIYNDHFNYIKEGKKNIFKKKENLEILREVEDLNKKLLQEISTFSKIIQRIKLISPEDFNFCKEEFKDNFEFIAIFLKTNPHNLNIKDYDKYIKDITQKIEDIYLMNNMLKLYSILAA